ncbi:hypothetical protein [Rhodococcus wratislaviensis]
MAPCKELRASDLGAPDVEVEGPIPELEEAIHALHRQFHAGA